MSPIFDQKTRPHRGRESAQAVVEGYSLHVMAKRVGISQAEVYERLGEFVHLVIIN